MRKIVMLELDQIYPCASWLLHFVMTPIYKKYYHMCEVKMYTVLCVKDITIPYIFGKCF